MKLKTSIKNARIMATSLGGHDGAEGMLTFWLHLRGDHWGCGFGGISLEAAPGISACLHSIIRVVGVQKWEDLEGQLVRAETEGLSGGIVALGNVIKNEWVTKAELSEMAKREESAD